MNKTRLDRRQFLSAGAVAALLPMVGTRGVFAADVAKVRHFWWGNPERDKRTFAVIDIFNEKHPDIEVVGETVSFPDYFPKLNTQIAGHNMPDVIQHGYGAIFEYIERGALLPLDEFVGKALDITEMDESAIKAGTFGGKLYALSIGANSHMTIYNADAFKKAGFEAGNGFDPFGWTYDDLKRMGVEIAKANEGMAGTEDATANYQLFSDFVTQNGVHFFNWDTGDIDCPAELVAEYFAIWKDIRDAGATLPGKASAGVVGAQMADWPLTKGTAATTFQWSNQLVGAQKINEARLEAAMYPNTAEMVPGSYVQPSQFICLTRDSANPAAAATYMSAFVNDTDMTNILGLERGIPANTVARNALIPTLSETEAKSVAYMDGIVGKTAPLPPPFPSGANEIEQTYQRIATGVLLEQDEIKRAAENFIRQAKFIRKRNS